MGCKGGGWGVAWHGICGVGYVVWAVVLVFVVDVWS